MTSSKKSRKRKRISDIAVSIRLAATTATAVVELIRVILKH
jgi:hypothetical protein